MGIIGYIKQNLDPILVSLILNVNVLRFFLNVGETNMLLYMMYILCIVVLWNKNIHHIIRIYKRDYRIKYDVLFWTMLLIYSIVTCVFITNELAMFFKFLVATIIGVLCIGEDFSKKRVILTCFYSINILYGLIVLLYPDTVSIYMKRNTNYLTMTLTLGFSFSISLVEIVYNLYNSKYGRMLISLALSVFYFFVLMRFTARGVLLFPPLIMIAIAFLKGGQNKGKLIVLLIFFTVMLLAAIQYFLENMSGYALSHMTGLFEDTDDESRMVVWNTSIKTMIDNLWIFFGGGFNGLSAKLNFYPHNIFLHILGDFGILFLFGFIYLIILVIKKFLKDIRKSNYFRHQEIIIICFSGFLYYLLTFCKSFSMYDSCPLLIMISLCLTFNTKPEHDPKKTLSHHL